MPIRDILKRMRHDGYGGRPGRAELLTSAVVPNTTRRTISVLANVRGRIRRRFGSGILNTASSISASVNSKWAYLWRSPNSTAIRPWSDAIR